ERAVHRQLAVVGTHERGVERDLRVLGGGEEVVGQHVPAQRLVLDGDRVDVDGALEAQRAVVGGHELRVVVLERAAEGGNDHVLHGEPDGRMKRVDAPGAAGRDRGGGGDGGHVSGVPL